MSSFSPSALISSCPTSILFSLGNVQPHIVGRSANYEPSIWGDRFLEYNFDKMSFDASTQQVEELKDEVRQMLKADGPNPSSELIMSLIDTLQRLGLAYHFEKEIEKALEQLFNDGTYYDTDDLYTIALHFQLLRQHGYNVSCDVFGKHKDKTGHFIGGLTDDVSIMLSLYEATHLRVHGENILDEAFAFTRSRLSSMANHLSSPLTKQVKHALTYPLHKTMPRFEANHYISIYHEDVKHNKQLLQLAKLDFNLLQSLHHKVLSQLSKWWKSLQFASKLPFARDRLVECYFWSLGTYFKPHYSLARIILTKVLCMTSVVDDIYDVYGTLEELDLFTDAIQRWDITAIDKLPEYMKVTYFALMDVYKGIEDEMTKQGRLYSVHHAKQVMKDAVKAYHVEAKWFNEGYIPTMEEYMHNASFTGGYLIISLTSFVGMGDIASKEAFDWINADVIPVKASNVIARLVDDIESRKFEQKRGHVASSVECYMKQYNVSKQEAYDELNKMINRGWKDLNKGCLKPTVVPMPLLMRVVNLTRIIDLIYKYGGGYTHSHLVLKDYIISLLINPIPI